MLIPKRLIATRMLHVAFACSLLAATCCGCKSMRKNALESLPILSSEDEQEPSPEEIVTERPVKLVAVWKESTLPSQTGKAIRGFLRTRLHVQQS